MNSFKESFRIQIKRKQRYYGILNDSIAEEFVFKYQMTVVTETKYLS